MRTVSAELKSSEYDDIMRKLRSYEMREDEPNWKLSLRKSEPTVLRFIQLLPNCGGFGGASF